MGIGARAGASIVEHCFSQPELIMYENGLPVAFLSGRPYSSSLLVQALNASFFPCTALPRLGPERGVSQPSCYLLKPSLQQPSPFLRQASPSLGSIGVLRFPVFVVHGTG